MNTIKFLPNNKIQLTMFNKTMSKIKFINYNSLNQPQTVILTMFGKQKI